MFPSKLLVYMYIYLWIDHNPTWAYKCNLVNRVCTFSGKEPSESSLYQASGKAQYVEEIRFDDCVIHTLTEKLCETFPNIKKLEAEKLSMKTVQPNALHACKNLTKVSFWKNELETLDQNLLQGSSKLVYVSFQDNHLKSIDGQMFGAVKNLRELYLAGNFLTEFPIHTFTESKQLKILSIHSNKLTDLDEQSLINKLPNLKSIHLQGNLFDCNRLKIIIDAIKRNGVELEDLKDATTTLNVRLNMIDHVQCVVNPVDYSIIIGIGVLMILLNIVPVVGYIIWKQYC